MLFGVAGLAEAVGAGLVGVPAARAAPALVWALAAHVMASGAREPESLRRRPTGLSAYTRVAVSVLVLGVLLVVLDRGARRLGPTRRSGGPPRARRGCRWSPGSVSSCSVPA